MEKLFFARCKAVALDRGAPSLSDDHWRIANKMGSLGNKYDLNFSAVDMAYLVEGG